jgi:hypothetical protein
VTAYELQAEEFIEKCRIGFRNEHHWQAWLREHQRTIDSLPPKLRRQVLAAHENSGLIEETAEAKPEVNGAPWASLGQPHSSSGNIAGGNWRGVRDSNFREAIQLTGRRRTPIRRFARTAES